MYLHLYCTHILNSSYITKHVKRKEELIFNFFVHVVQNNNSGQDLVTLAATDPDTHTAFVYSVNVIQPAGKLPDMLSLHFILCQAAFCMTLGNFLMLI